MRPILCTTKTAKQYPFPAEKVTGLPVDPEQAERHDQLITGDFLSDADAPLSSAPLAGHDALYRIDYPVVCPPLDVNWGHELRQARFFPHVFELGRKARPDDGLRQDFRALVTDLTTGGLTAEFSPAITSSIVVDTQSLQPLLWLISFNEAAALQPLSPRQASFQLRSVKHPLPSLNMFYSFTQSQFGGDPDPTHANQRRVEKSIGQMTRNLREMTGRAAFDYDLPMMLVTKKSARLGGAKDFTTPGEGYRRHYPHWGVYGPSSSPWRFEDALNLYILGYFMRYDKPPFAAPEMTAIGIMMRRNEHIFPRHDEAAADECPREYPQLVAA